MTVSNEVAEHAVVSPSSGYIYEKRLILKYIQENGTDPMTNEALTPEQLIEVKCKNPAFPTNLLHSSTNQNLLLFSQSINQAKTTIGHEHTSPVEKPSRRMGQCHASQFHYASAAANSPTGVITRSLSA